MFLKSSSRLQRGQALLVIVLVMVVALTAGLSVAIRTTTNIRIAEEDENSQKAFSAAEAGLEQSLGSNPVGISGSLDGASYETSISDYSGASFVLNNGTSVLKDEPVDVWLSDYPSFNSPWSGDLTISWGATTDTCSASETANTQAALEVVVISTSTPASPKTSPKLATYAFDPCADRRANNKFDSVITPGDSIGGNNFAYKKTITLSAAEPGLLIRVLPLYAPAKIAVQASNALPTQGKLISSTGKLDSVQRKIISFRGHPKLPIEVFPFIIFSPK